MKPHEITMSSRELRQCDAAPAAPRSWPLEGLGTSRLDPHVAWSTLGASGNLFMGFLMGKSYIKCGISLDFMDIICCIAVENWWTRWFSCYFLRWCSICWSTRGYLLSSGWCFFQNGPSCGSDFCSKNCQKYWYLDILPEGDGHPRIDRGWYTHKESHSWWWSEHSHP